MIIFFHDFSSLERSGMSQKSFRSSSLTKALDAILRLLVSLHTNFGKANFHMCRDTKRVKMSNSSI